ncbi:response regulator [Vallitalea okinawensis]|uniref:response regulator n=1 Tax=Vallitalea okinawensis TaxID=2078660 RepID=UPI000CFB22CA|nr:response regulator [Vallitalea okinawensis]
MYKLMLVDDEYTVRKSVINKIDWNQYGFEIICEAENGKEAYDMFEQHKPDVVITDIKMPYMDGLELSELILEKYPFTKIIVLTGFDEFEYAKKGIDLKISDYILKPISSKELIKVLQQMKEKIDNEIKERRDLDHLKDHYEKSYPVMKNIFLKAVVNGEYNYEEINRWLDYYDVDLKGELYLVAVIKIDHYYKERKTIDLKKSELKKVALLHMVKEIDEKAQIGPYFLENNQVIIIAKSNKKSEIEFIQDYIPKLEEIRQGVEKYLQFTITIGVGHVCKNVLDLHHSLKSAFNAHDYKMVVGNNQVIYINDLEDHINKRLQLNEIDQKRLVRILKAGTKEEFFLYTDQMFNEITRCNAPINEYQIYLLESVTIMIKTAKEINIEMSELTRKNMNIFSILSENNHLEDIKNELDQVGEKIIEHNMLGRVQSTTRMVSKAKEYVIAHYNDMELNIEKISEYLHYSPNYFSTIFKKETGEAFMNYLLDIRLEAGKELLLTTDMKTFEIALEVGFASPNYFSFCFKKRMGISPSQYKKQYK